MDDELRAIAVRAIANAVMFLRFEKDRTRVYMDAQFDRGKLLVFGPTRLREVTRMLLLATETATRVQSVIVGPGAKLALVGLVEWVREELAVPEGPELAA